MSTRNRVSRLGGELARKTTYLPPLLRAALDADKDLGAAEKLRITDLYFRMHQLIGERDAAGAMLVDAALTAFYELGRASALRRNAASGGEVRSLSLKNLKSALQNHFALDVSSHALWDGNQPELYSRYTRYLKQQIGPKGAPWAPSQRQFIEALRPTARKLGLSKRGPRRRA